ncbi:pitrilysin [Thorsellia kenyensis]|uniref:Protease 3 n=1 Tax=Thorsellia kenyensis TaxID=1549888 RepID=A0ABV6CFG6_9GAMM
MKKSYFKKRILTTVITGTLITSFLSSNISLISQAKASEASNSAHDDSSSALEILNIKINKSPADNRIYQPIKLSNQMTVLLVSDPKATRSMGVLALPIGSLDDPSSQQGLAHYLEHMVLMGSEKYPEPSGFSEFLKKFGGMHNASTAAFRTNYFFEIDDSGFEEGLDRLADAIAAPLLDPINADKERNAVNSELTLARARDGMRIAQIGSETLNPAHPVSQFFGGNLETLSDKPESKLQEELTRFYQENYSANYMVGVIYSPRDIEALKTLAVNTFGRIPNHNKNSPELNIPVVRDEDRGVFIHYVPVQPQKRLNIEFILTDTQIDPQSRRFLEKNETYISYLLSNSDKGTLSSELKNRGLINTLSAGAYLPQFRNAGTFNISIELTDKGYENKEDVIAAVFKYIDLIKEKGIQTSYFDEIKRVLNIDYEFPTLTRDLDYVSDLADNMLLYPLENVLDVDHAISEMNPEAIKNRLNQFTLDNARIWIMSPDEKTDKVAYFVDAPYKIAKISPEDKNSLDERKKNWTLSLPQLNPFLADDFSLVHQADDSISIPAKINSLEIAQLAKNEALKNLAITVYSMPSLSFINQPQADVTLKLRTAAQDVPEALNEQKKQQILSALVDYIAVLRLNELRFKADIAGISFSSYDNAGLTINANGYTQHLLELLAELINQYAQFNISEQELAQAKLWYKEKLDQADNVKPYELAIQPIQVVSQLPYFERDDRRQALEDISLSEVVEFKDQLFSNKGLEILSVGNLTNKQIADFINELASASPQLIHKDTSAFDPFIYPKLKISHPAQAQITRKGTTTDSAIFSLFVPLHQLNISQEADKQLFKDEAKTRLLNEIIQPWFYDKLRSQEQLGYALFTLSMPVGEQFGLGFLLQSNIKQPAELKTYFDAFYHEAQEKLKALSDNDFEQYKSGLLSQLLEPEQTLSEEASRFLTDFHKMNAEFNRRQELINALKNTNKEELINYYNTLVLEQDRLSLISEVSGTEQKESRFSKDKNTNLFKTASELQHWLLEINTLSSADHSDANNEK